jgi:cell division septation protein DedD
MNRRAEGRWHGARRRAGALLAVVGGLTFLVPGRPAQAQTDPRLVEAVRTAQEGASDSARGIVRRLLEATPPGDSLYPEILYTQAMVAGEAGEMRRHLQRIVVEYNGSSWADDALLRLVQMDYATRNLDAAARNLERLRLDYPQTPLVAQAAYWAGRTYFDLKTPAPGCRWLAEGLAQAQDIETRNQLDFLHQRCGTEQPGAAADSSGRVRDSARTAVAPPAPVDTARPADSAARRPPADSGPARSAAPQARYRIQVAAVATPGAADDAAGKVEKLGYPAVIVRERGLYKVRAGAFGSRAEAQAAVGRLKASMGGSPFVVAEP